MKMFRSSVLALLVVLSMIVSACGASSSAGGAGTATPGAAAPTVAAGAATPTAMTPAQVTPTAMIQPSSPEATATTMAQPTATAQPASPAPAPGGSNQYGELKVIQVEPNAHIVFSGWGDQTEQQVYRDSITRFKQFYPDVTVDYQPIPSDFQTKMKAEMAGGTAPDVMYIDNQLITAFGPTGQLMPLDQYMAQAGTTRNDFIQTLLNEFTINNQTYALPKDWGSLGLVYLPEAFQQAGIAEPTASWKWQDLMTAAEAINKAGKYKAFCMGADWARFAPFVYQAGGQFTSSDFKSASLDSSAVTTAGNFVFGLKKSGDLVTPSDVGASWCGEAIGKQLVAMTYEGGWMVNFMNQTYPSVKYNDVPLPAGPNGQANIIFTNGIGVNASSKFPMASAALAIFLTSRYNQGAIQQTGFAYSTHPDQLSQLTNPIDKNISVGSSWPATGIEWFGPNTGKFETAVSNALNRVFLGQQTVEESFKQAQQEGQAALDGQ